MYAVFVSIFQLFRNSKQDSAVRRSSLTIKEALEAARQAGRQTGDTGLFNQWLKVKGLFTRGNVLVSRMHREYENGFEERFQSRSEEVTMQAATAAGNAPMRKRPVASCAEGGTRDEHPLSITPARQANLEFLARVKAISPKLPAGEPTGNSRPSRDDPAGSISALYESGKAGSLKEALVILGGGR